jgi:hypothetical protein
MILRKGTIISTRNSDQYVTVQMAIENVVEIIKHQNKYILLDRVTDCCLTNTCGSTGSGVGSSSTGSGLGSCITGFGYKILFRFASKYISDVFFIFYLIASSSSFLIVLNIVFFCLFERDVALPFARL